ncbi:MAG: MMPL family transporter [Dinghuibacter sp.]|nr:MMPL family transporter [Dinghuibacter sp.]
MWLKVAQFVYRARFVLLAFLLAFTAFMGWQATRVKLSYEFVRAIPVNNPKYQAYQEFRKKFGEDGNLMVAGIQTPNLFTEKNFTAYTALHNGLKKIPGVDDVLSIPSAVNLQFNADSGKLGAKRIFTDSTLSGEALNAARTEFEGLPFYRGLLYNPETRAYMMGIKVNGDTLNSKSRENVMRQIAAQIDSFEQKTQINVHRSGLPLIRSVMATRIQHEMKIFLLASVLLAAIILLLFFRSVSAMLISLAVVGVGVVSSLGTMALLGYQISVLNALIPPLMVVIGVPNCIYFLNKYHSNWIETGDKKQSLVNMIGKMGVVTLFCNITAAIGFAVFAITQSQILKEFGIVAGINILLLFFISLALIPALLSLLPPPGKHQTKYLNSRVITGTLERMEHWVVNHPKFTFTGTFLLLLISTIGLFRLKSQGFIVDDIPHNDKVYTDLKFFEKHFRGVMPLEITIHVPREKEALGDKAWRQFVHKMIEKVGMLEDSLYQHPALGKPTSLVDGLKFIYRARTMNDTVEQLDGEAWSLVKQGLLQQGLDSSRKGASTGVNKLMSSFIDSAKHEMRISVPMADVGTLELNRILGEIEQRVNSILDSSKNIYILKEGAVADSTKFQVAFTGTTVTFLEGSNYIIKGLKESIFWAFLLIAISMLFLFRSWRILLCSLIPNVVPLIITAGLMGWMGIPLKPSTVLVFSVTLGIAIDITIRFLVNYRQVLPQYGNNPMETVKQTIRQTGLSIIYTSLVLIAGFVIFIFSGFGGIKALGLLTTITLLVATVTNLVLLPVLLLLGRRGKK